MNIFDKYYYGQNGDKYKGNLEIIGKKIDDEINTSEINVTGILKARKIRCNGLYVKGSVECEELEAKFVRVKGKIILKTIKAEKLNLLGQMKANNTSTEEINAIGKLESQNLSFKSFYFVGEIFSNLVEGENIEIEGNGEIEKIKCKEIKIKNTKKGIFQKISKIKVGSLIANNVDLEECIIDDLECNSGKLGKGAIINHLNTTGEVQISEEACVKNKD